MLAIPPQGSPAGHFHYFFYGQHLCSSLSIRSLPAWTSSDPDSVPDIALSCADAPRSLEDTVWSSHFVQIGRNKGTLINIAAVARFYLPGGDHAGKQIVIQPAPTAQLHEVETILLSTVAGMVLYQRGLTPLHASAVLFDGRALAITGFPACGRSTLAAALVQRGATFLADDIAVLDLTQPSLRILAGATHARLWPDAMDHLAIPHELRLPTREHIGKHAVAMPTPAAHSWPLHTVIRFGAHSVSESPEIQRLHGPKSVLPADQFVYQRKIGRFIGSAAAEFRTLNQLAQHASIYSLRRTRRIAQLDHCVDLVLKAFGGEV